jgi:hypothetical protein
VYVSSYVLLQSVVIAHFFDMHFDNNKPNLSLFYQWLGFWIFSPTFVFNFSLVLYITFEKNIRTWNINKKQTDTESQRLKKMSSEKRRNDFDMDEEEEEEDDEDDVEGGEKPRGVDSTEITADEETRVISLNVSLMQKWLWTTPSVFLAACKISWDHKDNYTWKFIFTPLALYVVYFIWVGYKHENWLWQDQRDIDEAEKRQLQLDAEAKLAVKKRAKSNAKSIIVDEDDDQDGI